LVDPAINLIARLIEEVGHTTTELLFKELKNRPALKNRDSQRNMDRVQFKRKATELR
jgi:hypothetical protein